MLTSRASQCARQIRGQDVRLEQGLIDAQERGDEEGVVQRAAEPAHDAGPAEEEGTATVLQGTEHMTFMKE